MYRSATWHSKVTDGPVFFSLHQHIVKLSLYLLNQLCKAQQNLHFGSLLRVLVDSVRAEVAKEDADCRLGLQLQLLTFVYVIQVNDSGSAGIYFLPQLVLNHFIFFCLVVELSEVVLIALAALH